MENKMNSRKFVAINENVEGTNVIGKLVYYTIGKLMITEEQLREMLNDCDISETIVSNRYTNVAAFKTATNKVIPFAKNTDPKTGEEYRLRIFDNKREDNGVKVVREIKRENILTKSNTFTYLGNFTYLKDLDSMYFNLNEEKLGSIAGSVKSMCEQAMEQFEIEKHGFNEDRFANLVDKYMMENLQGTRIQIHGKLWFIPIFNNEDLIKIENLVEAVSGANTEDGIIQITSIPIMDEEKYVQKYTKEFYSMAESELRIYQNKLSELLTGDARTKTAQAWIQKAQAFMEKKKRYEDLFKRDLEEMDDDIQVMNRQIMELKYRTQSVFDDSPIEGQQALAL